jgi:hypothetical protein
MISNDAIHVQVKEERKDGNVKASALQKLTIECVWCMMLGDVLNLFLLRISDTTMTRNMRTWLWDG